MLRPFTTFLTHPTPDAIELAEFHALFPDRTLVASTVPGVEGTVWYLVNPNDGADFYTVDTVTGDCYCPTFAQNGICEHCIIVRDEIEVRNREEEMEQAWREVDAGED